MKKALALVLALMLILTLAACGAKTEEKYLTESFTQEIYGSVAQKTEYKYDKDWNLTDVISYQDGEETTRMSYEITETGALLTIKNGEETGTMEIVNTKDGDGNIVKTVQYMDGEPYSTSEMTYDESGRILTRTVAQEFNGISARYEYVYDENGNQTELTVDYGEDSGSRTVTEYDENGSILSQTTCDLDGNVTSKEEYVRDEYGVEHVTISDADGNISGTRFNTYDEAGNLLTSESCDASGELIIRTTYTYIKADVPVK